MVAQQAKVKPWILQHCINIKELKSTYTFNEQKKTSEARRSFTLPLTCQRNIYLSPLKKQRTFNKF